MIDKSNIVAILVREFGVGDPESANQDEKSLQKLKAKDTKSIKIEDSGT